jgi:hypothetical protein
LVGDWIKTPCPKKKAAIRIANPIHIPRPVPRYESNTMVRQTPSNSSAKKEIPLVERKTLMVD